MSSEKNKIKNEKVKEPSENISLWRRFVELAPVWVQIIIAVTAIVTVIITALVAPLALLAVQNYLSNKTPTPTINLTFTPTVTSTLISTPLPTETPLPTPTVDSSPNFTPAPATDWFSDCIDSNIWFPFLAGTVQQQNIPCYQLSSYGINAEGGKLIFVSNTSKNTAVEYGIFTPWQNWKQIDFSVQAKDLENSEIWIGAFEGDTIDSKGIVFVIQPGDDVDVRELPRENYPVDNTYLPFANGNFNVNITLSGGKIKFVVDGQGIISNWPVNFTIKNLFIGYRSLPNTLIDASVFNLNFK